MFCLFIMLAASIASVIMIQRLHIINAIKSNVNGVEQLFPTLLEMESIQLDSQLNILKRNEKLQKSWLAGDKKLLYQEAFTFFSEINSKYNITHFYFIDLDQAAFLRVHSPERFGDYINRATLNTAVRKGHPSSGIELGPLGTFTLRVVHPWIIDGVLI